MDFSDVLRKHRKKLGISQGQLAKSIGVGTRQIARYEAGEQQPVFSVAVSLADALQISLAQLAGREHRGVDLDGDWWAAWQTFKEGREYVSCQEAHILQEDENTYTISAKTRGLELEDGGYLWSGELRLWDDAILMGWYVATEAAVRSKGTMYFVIHPHGMRLHGRWVGLSYDGAIITGWAAMAHDPDETRDQIKLLTSTEGLSR